MLIIPLRKRRYIGLALSVRPSVQLSYLSMEFNETYTVLSISYHFPYILRKTIEGYLNSFDIITFGNIIFKQIIFVIDRIITMQFTKMHIEIHG